MSPKKGFKIGEVCKLLDIQPYVLRYWETEFVALHPASAPVAEAVRWIVEDAAPGSVLASPIQARWEAGGVESLDRMNRHRKTPNTPSP